MSGTVPLKHFLMEVEIVNRIEVRVMASTRDEASELAAAAAQSSMDGAGRAHQIRTLASWPLGEEPEVETTFPDGCTVRRGWFYEVTFEGGKYGHGYRRMSFDELFAGDGGEVPLSDFNVFVEAPEHATRCTRVFGYAATHATLDTWGRIRETEKQALKATRRFMDETRAMVRRNAEQARIDALLHKIVREMARYNGTLNRLPGGLWVAYDPALYSPDGEPQPYIDKTLVGLLLENDLAGVFDRMNQSGDPRVVTLSPKGWALAVKQSEEASA